jgi:hypothetical protein
MRIAVITSRSVFRLALRQTEGLIGSIIGLLGLDLAAPDHSTLSRRAGTLQMARPRHGNDPMHLLVNSTEAAVIVPPRSNAAPSAIVETAPTQRDRHLQLIAERGRIRWQKAAGYNRRALAEAAISRFKRVIGNAMRSRTHRRQATEVAIAVTALNRMLELGRPKSLRIA